jgi:predicted cupin superfamily sugar epimerase
VITPSGKYSRILLGKEDEKAVKEYNIPGGHWYAEEVTGSNGYSLVRATTKPGFHPDDAKQAAESELVELVKDNDEAVQTVNRFMRR